MNEPCYCSEHFFCIDLYILILHINNHQVQSIMDASVVQNPAESSATRSAMGKLQSIYQEQMSGSKEQVNQARLAMIATARDLITSLEAPLESIIWMAWAEVRHHPLCATWSIALSANAILSPAYEICCNADCYQTWSI